jgi:hypothetical protein
MAATMDASVRNAGSDLAQVVPLKNIILSGSFPFKPLISILDSTFARSNLRDGSLASVFAKCSPIGAGAFSLTACAGSEKDMFQRAPTWHFPTSLCWYERMVAVPTCEVRRAHYFDCLIVATWAQ